MNKQTAMPSMPVNCEVRRVFHVVHNVDCLDQHNSASGLGTITCLYTFLYRGGPH